MAKPLFTSALQQVQRPSNLAIDMVEVSDRGMIDIRCEANNKAFMAATAKVLGVKLPTQPRSSNSKDDITVLWLSIDQWLVTCPRDKAAEITEKLAKAAANSHVLVVDLSDARTIIRLTGEQIREVLMKAAPVDLTSEEVKAGHVRRLRFGEVAAMVHFQNDTLDVADLYVFRSYADYVWHYLIAIGAEKAQIGLFNNQPAPI